MASTGIASKTLLFPYWLTLVIRNKLYDRGVFKSESFDIPVISVGNISVGGTGKTPHTEMLVDLLKGKFRVAVISRGYKRKTKGFRLVKATDDFSLCGDEPLQIKRKFPDIIVAVCSDRAQAIRKVKEEFGVNLVILDDAYQHRKITPSCSILLVNYNRTIAGDNLLPIGLPSHLGGGVELLHILDIPLGSVVTAIAPHSTVALDGYLEGWHCIVETPLASVVEAILAHHIDIKLRLAIGRKEVCGCGVRAADPAAVRIAVYHLPPPSSIRTRRYISPSLQWSMTSMCLRRSRMASSRASRKAQTLLRSQPTPLQCR